ncbi:uncharacterized protein LOC118406435 [Branchiostoma floridae]|uniref:Uncharacterized protein LOC118406435 n=1 Tax=Branchiostoma floridae TaxID=7739 RepID=A0A9J7HQ85_BRAFL|nr:uncharacterized protein LOC118406435 [Branchiostoma floridae]
MDESENTAPTKPFEYCHKRNRPCSKPKGHPSRCDSKRPLEHRHQFWLNSAKHQKQQEQEKDNNVALENTQHSDVPETPAKESIAPAKHQNTTVTRTQQSLEPGVTQTPVKESIVPTKHQKTTVTIARTKTRPKKSARSKNSLPSQATAIAPWMYTERYKTKQKREYEELLERKKDLETEVRRLETKVGRETGVGMVAAGFHKNGL